MFHRSAALRPLALAALVTFLSACAGGALPPGSTGGPAASSGPLSETWGELPLAVIWLDGTAVGNWLARYNGYGTTQVVSSADGIRSLELAPRASTAAAETHAGLVLSSQRFGDLDATVALQTVAQLRSPQPNAWEMGWVLWHYQDDGHFYYLVLKPNGWELGKEDPAYPDSQRFLATGDHPVFPVGTWNVVQVTQRGSTMSAYANGVLLTTFEDVERPYLEGALGLYCEDSHVRFGTVSVK